MSMMGGTLGFFGVGRVYATWNPSDAGADWSFSGGNLVATKTASSSSIVRANTAKTTGKWYWEVTLTAVGTGTEGIGIADQNCALSAYLGFSVYGWGYRFGNGIVYNQTIPSFGPGGSFVSGDVIGMALDVDAGTLKFYQNNSLQVTATGIYSSGMSQNVFPALNLYGNTDNAKANFGATAFTYSPPSGYNAGVY